jgi:hypothetical protein
MEWQDNSRKEESYVGTSGGEFNFWRRVMAHLGPGRRSEAGGSSDDVPFSGYYAHTNSYPVTMGGPELNLEATYTAIENMGDYYETAMQGLAGTRDPRDPNIPNP